MFHSEPEIVIGETDFDSVAEDGTPFDLLGRKTSGERLSALVDRLTAPTVIALDGAWGSGKSHFLQLWCGAHGKIGKSVPIYIDAFAEDYLDDPLLSLVGAIDRITSKSGDATKPAILARLRRAAGPLTRSFLRVGVAMATAGVSEAVGAIGDAAAAAVADEGKDMMDEFWGRERGRADALSAFQTALADLAAVRPIVLIVDELDRCRPDYALSLLEIAKHSFAVSGVHFVLGVNLESLEHSVRKRYGSGIDAGLYLQKFHALRFGLPDKQDAKQQGWQHLLSAQSKRLALPGNLIHAARDILEIFTTQRTVTLRDAQRVTNRLALLGKIGDSDTATFRLLLVSLIVMEVMDAGLYRSIRRGKSEVESILTGLGLPPDPPRTERLAWYLTHAWRFLMADEPGEETTRWAEQAILGVISDRRELMAWLFEEMDLVTVP